MAGGVDKNKAAAALICQLLAGGCSWLPTLCPLSNCFVSSRSTHALSFCATGMWLFPGVMKKWYSVFFVPRPFPCGDYFLCSVPDYPQFMYSPVSVALSWRGRRLSQRGAAGGHGPALVLHGWGARAVTGCAPCSGRTWCGRASRHGEPTSDKRFRKIFNHTNLWWLNEGKPQLLIWTNSVTSSKHRRSKHTHTPIQFQISDKTVHTCIVEIFIMNKYCHSLTCNLKQSVKTKTFCVTR